MQKEKKFIGYYSLSVFVTYLGVISAVFGVYLALTRKITLAISCLIISGICDAFDGKIARKTKRTEQEKDFGIQLDSLADMVNFIFLPIAIFYGLGMSTWYNVVIYILFTLGGVIRLAYFNTVATKDAPVEYYSGLPVTTTAIIFPLLYILKYCVGFECFKIIYTISMLLTSILFISNFKLKKPKGQAAYLFLALGIVGIIILFILRLKGLFI